MTDSARIGRHDEGPRRRVGRGACQQESVVVVDFAVASSHRRVIVASHLQTSKETRFQRALRHLLAEHLAFHYGIDEWVMI